MDTTFYTPFVVYLHREGGPPKPPETVEPVEIHCATLAEAKQIRKDVQDPHLRCIIRYHGETGGGD